MKRLTPAVFALLVSSFFASCQASGGSSAGGNCLPPNPVSGVGVLKSWTVTKDSPARGYPVAAPLPAYPAGLAFAGETGICVVRVTVGPDGRVTAISVRFSTDKQLEEPTLAAVKQWRFVEVVNKKKNEQPLGMILECMLTFGLDDQ